MKQFHNIFLILVVMTILLCGCSKKSYLSLKNSSSDSMETSEKSSDESEKSESDSEEDGDSIYVQVAGAVMHPGVYKLEADGRVYQAIEMAGGLLEDADDSDLNLAQPLCDGQKITVLTNEQRAIEEAAACESNLVNINKADEATLMTLPGIGQSKASAIVKYRQSKGTFSKKEDLMNISGIKEGVYNKIEDLITR